MSLAKSNHSNSDFTHEPQIESLLPIVHRVASKMARNLPSYVSKDDLISLGTLGLMDALRRYDPAKGVKLETFITWRIRGAILDGLRDMDPVPRQVREHAREIEHACLAIEAEQLRSASDKEVSQLLGITESELNKRLYDISRSAVLSLDTPAEGVHEDQTSRLNVIPDTRTVLPEEEAIRQELIRTLADVVEHLPDKERLVVSLYYYEELTFKEIADVLSLTVSRISQLHTKAIFRLKTALAKFNIDLDN